LAVWISNSGLELTILDFDFLQAKVIKMNWRYFASCFVGIFPTSLSLDAHIVTVIECQKDVHFRNIESVGILDEIPTIFRVLE
jgi:hypothetical protein